MSINGYFDMNIELTDEDIALREAAHKFAKEVMRPVARELDAMTGEEAIAEGSPMWEFWKQAYQLGYHTILLPEYYGGLGLTPLQTHLVYEEMGWGSIGLSVMLAVGAFPFAFICMNGNEELVDKYVVPFAECTDGSIRGCWGITEPDHGSDSVGMGEEWFESSKLRGSLQARLDGDDWVLNGQKSAWVSGGTIATHTLLHVQIDPSLGFTGNGVCMVPLDLPGVAKGKPLEKIGQRDLNQGEIFFDNVHVPQNHMLVEPDFYVPLLDMILASANMSMACWSTGVARAAFEESLEYAKERVQGGRPIIEHYTTKQRVFKLFARTETCRALSRAVLNLNLNVSPPVTEYSLVAKTQCTEMAYRNAHDSVQLFGGNGLTKEYLIEKLFRDSRASLIEDGNNETLQRHGGHLLKEDYPRPPLDF